MRYRSAIGLALLIAMVVIGAFSLLGDEWRVDQRWRTFAADHSCKPVAVMRGDRSMPVGHQPKFDVDGSVPDKVGHLCDDGITYWR